MNYDGWLVFERLCKEFSKQNKLEDFFDLVLTPDEKNDISTRCLIVKELLDDHITQREMSETLGVSIAKITRGSNGLKRLGQEFRKHLIRVLRKL